MASTATISQFLYSGLATPSNNVILPESPLWLDELANECATFDLDAANQALDELGLDQRNPAGIRLLPGADGAGGREFGRGQRADRRPRAHRRPMGRDRLQDRPSRRTGRSCAAASMPAPP